MTPEVPLGCRSAMSVSGKCNAGYGNRKDQSHHGRYHCCEILE